MANAASMRMRWHSRSKLSKMLIVGLVAVSASLLPAAGSFVPRDRGNVIFGDVAHAACKWNGKPGPGGLWNTFDEWWFKASVVSNWCYSGGHVTSRHSDAGGSVTFWGAVAGWFLTGQEWAYSKCHYYNGYWNHNCLTQREFNLANGHTGHSFSICIHTRIYGNGAHTRRITHADYNACPGG